MLPAYKEPGTWTHLGPTTVECKQSTNWCYETQNWEQVTPPTIGDKIIPNDRIDGQWTWEVIASAPNSDDPTMTTITIQNDQGQTFDVTQQQAKK
jgi:hypothetical protein